MESSRHTSAPRGDGEVAVLPDLYAHFSHEFDKDPRWTQPLDQVFHQQFTPSDVPSHQIIAEFANKNRFEM